MGKAFVADIVALVPTLASDKNGRRAVLYLLTPTSTRHFIPSTLSSLSASAEKAREIGTSKKDPATRRKELVGYASPGLLDVIAEKGAELVRDPGAGLLVQEIMLYAQGGQSFSSCIFSHADNSDKSKAIESLVAPLQTPYNESAAVAEDEVDDQADPEAIHVLDLAHCTRTYKTLLSGGHFDMTTKTVDVIDPTFSAQFAQAFWSAMTSSEAGGEENAVRLAKGNAPFVMVELVEALKRAGKGGDVKRVLGGKEVRTALEHDEKKGLGLLLEKLTEL